MSKEMKRGLAGGTLLTLIGALLVLLVFANPSQTGADETPPREIVMEARDLAFDGENPTIHAEPGERIRLVVTNTDPGVLHSISIPGIDSKVRHIKYGETVSFEITVPGAGTYEYTCPQHAPKMRGKIVIAGGS
jgi:plastocyanin